MKIETYFIEYRYYWGNLLANIKRWRSENICSYIKKGEKMSSSVFPYVSFFFFKSSATVFAKSEIRKPLQRAFIKATSCQCRCNVIRLV